VRLLLLALLVLGCRSMETSHEPVDTGKGVPAGWDATEKTELRTGAYLVLRDVTRMAGPEGIGTFIREQRLRERPDGIPPTRLAEQLAMFLVRGESRRESSFKVVSDPAHDAPEFASHLDKLHAPETRIVEHDLFVHKSWILHGGTARHLVVEVGRDGTAKADLTEWLPRDPAP
jgi:hypothetical protein